MMKMKILHLTFHGGCALEIANVMSIFGHDVTTVRPGDYNIGHDLAAELWTKHGAEWSQYDLVITSDTAPLARPFLQHDYQGSLLIWICNRFDYTDAANNRCGFPDPEFYDLFRTALDKPRVALVPYTQFESVYCAYRGIQLREPVIKPTGIYARTSLRTDYAEDPSCFVIPRHNETIMIDLPAMLNQMGIPAVTFDYSHPSQIIQYKVVISIPYSWSTLAGFANAGMGLTTFIPTQRFLRELFNGKNWFFPNLSLETASLELAESYDPDNTGFYRLFDSWDNLTTQLGSFRKEEAAPKVLETWQNNYTRQLAKWSQVIERITS
jgi:hypothetical protein